MSKYSPEHLALEIINGIIIVSLLIVICVMAYKHKPQNYYTRVATFELVLALLIRLALGALYELNQKDPLLFDYRFDVPYYIIIKIQFAIIVGWITITYVVMIIQNIKDNQTLKAIEKSEKKIKSIFQICTFTFWALLLVQMVLVVLPGKLSETSIIFYIMIFFILNVFIWCVLLMYCFVYMKMLRTFKSLARMIDELQSPNPHQNKRNQPSEVQVEEKLASKSFARSFRPGSFAIETNGNVFRTKSMRELTKDMIQFKCINEENAEINTNQILIEVPWDKIKFRFNLFFIASILLLTASALFNVITHLFRSFDPDQHYSTGDQIFFSVQTVLGALGMIVYNSQMDDKIMQQHQSEVEEPQIANQTSNEDLSFDHLPLLSSEDGQNLFVQLDENRISQSLKHTDRVQNLENSQKDSEWMNIKTVSVHSSTPSQNNEGESLVGSIRGSSISSGSNFRLMQDKFKAVMGDQKNQENFNRRTQMARQQLRDSVVESQ